MVSKDKSLDRDATSSPETSHRTGQAWDRDPLDILDEEHSIFLDVCAVLEHVADGLPDEADLCLAVNAADIVVRHQGDHYASESGVLFPALRQKVGNDHLIARILEQLDSHREQDVDVANEILDVLQSQRDTRKPTNPGMIGYMLRHYFIGERRQIAWERRIVLPAARMLLDEADMSRLAERLARRHQQPVSEDPTVLAVRRAAKPAVECWARNIKTTTN